MSNSSLKMLPTLLVGIALFMAAFASTANAAEVAAFNFEDSTLGGLPDFTSEANEGIGIASTITTNYIAVDMTSVAGITGVNSNPIPGDSDPNVLALGLTRTGDAPNNPADFNIPLVTAAGIQNMNLSFAITGTSSGFTTATLFYSTNGGATFTNSGISHSIANTTQTLSFGVPAAADNAPNLELRIEFTTGQSNGVGVQDTIDNIQVTGTINPAGVPDTGTTASLFGFSLAGLAFLRRKLA